MKTRNILLSCALVASLGLFGIMGCSSGSASSSASAEASSSSASSEALEVTSSTAAELPTVGDAANSAASFELTNKTGADIVGVSVKTAGAADYSANMLAAGQKIPNGETVKFYCPKAATEESQAAAEPQSESSESSADVKLNEMVDVRIELADGKTYELHQVTVEEIASTTLALSGGVAFLEYTAIQGGSVVSTLESEQAIARAAEEAAQAQQEEQAAQEEQAEPETTEQADVTYQEQEPVYYDDAAYVDDTAYTNTSGNGGGDGAACVDDIVLNF